jgi:hypothetical protein
MIACTANINEDLERTQRLPVFTAEVQLGEALERERAERIEIVELMRQNLQQAKEIEQLRAWHVGVPSPHANRFGRLIEQYVTTEERLFVVCGALKDALSKVLSECGARKFALNCGRDAGRRLEDSCFELEQILRAPGFSAPAVRRADTGQEDSLVDDSQTAELVFLTMPVMPGESLAPAEEPLSAAG